MDRLQRLQYDELFDWVWDNWKSSFGLGVFNEFYKHSALEVFDQEIVENINNMPLNFIDSDIPDRKDILEIIFHGRYYALQPRKDKIMSDHTKSKKIKKPTFIKRMFIPVPILGYYGFLKYHIDSIKAFAPEGADYYETGIGFIANLAYMNEAIPDLKFNYYWSLFGLNRKLKLDRIFTESMLHVMQIKFYKK